jgi:glycosyltransferase involved in cell wall biosynthesis
MRLLWVKAGKILPVNTGGRIRSYNILKHLAARNEVIFLSYYPGARDEEYERAVTARFPGAVVFPAGASDGAVQQLLAYARRLLSHAPYAVSKFTDQRVRDAIQRVVSTERPDVVVCDFLSASLNFSETLPVASILFQHNVEQSLWNRQAAHERNPLKRLLFAMEAAKMRRYERATVGRFDHVIAVSDHDRSLMLSMTDPSRITVVPTGVDSAAYRAQASAGRGSRKVMFLGSMDWEANVDGVEYFCEQIWPRIVATVPDARFQVVGRSPAPRIQRLASETIDIVGGVDDVIPYLHASEVFVVPLRIGGGTRLKIYEAMAAERAVVSTTVGAEGLDVRNGRDIVLADEPSEFADAVIRLLTEQAAREAMGRAAGETAARFDWSAVALDFESTLRSTTAQRSPRPREVGAA